MSDPFDWEFNASGLENELWSDAFGEEFRDPVAEALFHAAYFDRGAWEPAEVSAIRENLAAYLLDEYGVAFEDVFDWEAWREAYGLTG